MTAISRLESALPQLDKLFQKASPLKQKKAVLEACVVAVSRAGLEEVEVKEAIEILRSGGVGKSLLLAQLGRLATAFDDRYFELSEKGGEGAKHEALRLFSKARATTALLFALSDHPEHLREALYETSTSMNDPAEIIQVVNNALR